MSKYQPRFKPEVYMRFLNSCIIPNLWKDSNFFMIHTRTKTDDEKILYVIETHYEGHCLEECLDKAILATKFEERL